MNENERVRVLVDSYFKMPPTQKELKKLKSLLYDFGITVSEFPVFKSRLEMNDWKRKTLQSVL